MPRKATSSSQTQTRPRNVSITGITINNGMLCFPLAQLGKVYNMRGVTGGGGGKSTTNTVAKRRGRPAGTTGTAKGRAAGSGGGD